MNYDISEQEFALCVQLHELVTPFTEEKTAALNDPAAQRDYLGRVLSRLAETPYLKLGIAPVDGLDGLLSLMRAMEVVAAVSP
jgi:hypothetical protein